MSVVGPDEVRGRAVTAIRASFSFGRRAQMLGTTQYAGHEKFVVEASFEVVPSGETR